MFDWLKDLAGKSYGEIEKGLHHPLTPITHYMFEVSPSLWRGSWPSKAELTFLQAKGIKTVINLCAERDQYEPLPGMVWTRIPVTDCTAPSYEQAEEFLADVKARGPVYVHCEAGKGRTGCMVAAYRVRWLGWPPIGALQEAINFGLSEPCQKKWILGL